MLVQVIFLWLREKLCFQWFPMVSYLVCYFVYILANENMIYYIIFWRLWMFLFYFWVIYLGYSYTQNVILFLVYLNGNLLKVYIFNWLEKICFVTWFKVDIWLTIFYLTFCRNDVKKVVYENSSYHFDLEKNVAEIDNT